MGVAGAAAPARPPRATPAPAAAPQTLHSDAVSLQAPAPPAAAPPAPTAPAPKAEPPARTAPAPEPDIHGFLLSDVEAPRVEHEAEVAYTDLRPEPADDASDDEVAEWCRHVAKSGLPTSDRTQRIASALARAVERAALPNRQWTKATPQQVKLFVQETLEHTDAVARVGKLRGMPWNNHDFEGSTSKFNPQIAQFMAKPGKDASVEWAIQRHNAAPHHAVWSDPQATSVLLKESASDIVNAWRMNRRVYDKPSWSWERIFRFIEVSFGYNEISAAQRDALLEAIPWQMEEERRNGLPA